MLGCIWLSVDNDSAFLSDVIVFPEFQGKGVGKSFMRSFIDELITLGVSEVELRVSPGNQHAMNLYKNLGFRITGFDMSLALSAE